MFFKKIHTQPAPETAQSSAEQHLIYVLGDDDLALFLAAKLQENGQKIVLLTTSAPAIGYRNLNLTLKEEYNLQKKDLVLHSTSYASQTPDAILIACKNNSFRAHLTLLPSSRYQETPIICFNPMADTETIRPLLGTCFYKAYFSGYLSANASTITSCGLMPELILSAARDTKKEDPAPHPAEAILALCGLKLSLQNKDKENFWKTQASRILGYLATAPKQSVQELLNNKEQKNILTQAAKEICQLAKFEKVKLSSEDIIRELFDTPRNFYYKSGNLSKIENASQLEKLYNMLSEKARTYKCKIPELNRMIKQNYDNLLKK